MATECTVTVLDQGTNDASEEGDGFWALLTGNAGDIGQSDEASDDEVVEFMPLLYRLGGHSPE